MVRNGETENKELGKRRPKRQRRDTMEMQQLVKKMFRLETARQSRITAEDNVCERATATEA
jgi:hypothetical protein